MDRIVTFLLVLVLALLLVPGCIAEELAAPLASDVAGEVLVAEVTTEKVVEDTTEETTEEVFAYNISADVNTTELNMTLNQVAMIQLSENPTTGFSWNVTLSDGLTLLNDRYVQDPTPEGWLVLVVSMSGTLKLLLQVTRLLMVSINSHGKKRWAMKRPIPWRFS